MAQKQTDFDGVLFIFDGNTFCARCRDGIEPSPTGAWAVLQPMTGKKSRTYHVPCAIALGWVPSDIVAAYLAHT